MLKDKIPKLWISILTYVAILVFPMVSIANGTYDPSLSFACPLTGTVGGIYTMTATTTGYSGTPSGYFLLFNGVVGSSTMVSIKGPMSGNVNAGSYQESAPNGTNGWTSCKDGGLNLPSTQPRAPASGNYYAVLAPWNGFTSGSDNGWYHYFTDGSRSLPSSNYGLYNVYQGVSTGIMSITSPANGTTTPTGVVSFKFLTYVENQQANIWNIFIKDNLTNLTYLNATGTLSTLNGSGQESQTYAMPQGNYTAYISLYSATTTISWGTVQTTFNVIYNPLASLLGATSTDLTALMGLATSTCSIANITGCVQNAMVFLFYPSPSVLNVFSDLKTTIQNKPPFGYVNVYANQLLSLSANASPAFTLATSSAIKTNIFDPLRAGLVNVIYVCFALWFFNRLRHFEI